jgi:hypothetical protein
MQELHATTKQENIKSMLHRGVATAAWRNAGLMHKASLMSVSQVKIT